MALQNSSPSSLRLLGCIVCGAQKLCTAGLGLDIGCMVAHVFAKS